MNNGWGSFSAGNTGTIPTRACRLCGRPEHGSLACSCAPGWPVRTGMVEHPDKDARIAALEAQVEARKTYDAEVVEPRICELEGERRRMLAALCAIYRLSGARLSGADFSQEAEHK